MMSTKLLESPGTATRTACGKTMCQKPCILVMPQAKACLHLGGADRGERPAQCLGHVGRGVEGDAPDDQGHHADPLHRHNHLRQSVADPEKLRQQPRPAEQRNPRRADLLEPWDIQIVRRRDDDGNQQRQQQRRQRNAEGDIDIPNIMGNK